MKNSTDNTNKWLHTGVTFVWLGFWLIYGFANGLLLLDLNEVGDFLAGVAAPAAFYWLIVGYGLQRKELSLSVNNLRCRLMS